MRALHPGPVQEPERGDVRCCHRPVYGSGAEREDRADGYVVGFQPSVRLGGQSLAGKTMTQSRRDFLGSVACAFAAAGVACKVPKWATVEDDSVAVPARDAPWLRFRREEKVNVIEGWDFAVDDNSAICTRVAVVNDKHYVLDMQRFREAPFVFMGEKPTCLREVYRVPGEYVAKMLENHPGELL